MRRANGAPEVRAGQDTGGRVPLGESTHRQAGLP